MELLGDAVGGARDSNMAACNWTAEEYAEHIAEQHIKLVETVLQHPATVGMAEQWQDLCSDSFDLVSEAIGYLGRRAQILDRLIDSGRVTESEVDDIDDALFREAAP